MRVLVDTSIWSLALRRSRPGSGSEASELRRLVAEHLVEIIGTIRQEVLSGVRAHLQFDRLEAHLRAFADAPVLTEDYVTAARFYNLCRSRGIQGSNTDFLVCAVAVRNNFAVFTTDKDFSLFAKRLPIALHTIGNGVESARCVLVRKSQPRRAGITGTIA